MTLSVKQLPIDKLVPDPRNPRRIDDDELERLTRSVQEFGFVAPIIARQADHRVIGGHQRLLAARRLGMTKVPVVLVDLTAEQADLLNIALNQIGGHWDDALLAQLLARLQQESEGDVTLSGFSDAEIAALLKTLETRTKRDRPETFDLVAALDQAKEKETRVQPGELWLLGAHRLLCGDATNGDDVTRLLDGRPARMAFTDPPYNVALGDHGGQPRSQKKRRIANDALSPDAWAAFCTGWATNLLQHVDGACYVCMSTKEWPIVSHLLAEADGHWSDTIIWAKDRHVLGRADYQRRYEPIWYGWREGVDHHWCGDRDQTDVWQIPRPAVADLHPTMKPLGLVERAINNSSEPNDLVLDLFVGSGTTLVAAERTGRIGCGLEIDPHYCDVVIARWEAFSGEEARRA